MFNEALNKGKASERSTVVTPALSASDCVTFSAPSRIEGSQTYTNPASRVRTEFATAQGFSLGKGQHMDLCLAEQSIVKFKNGPSERQKRGGQRG